MERELQAEAERAIRAALAIQATEVHRQMVQVRAETGACGRPQHVSGSPSFTEEGQTTTRLTLTCHVRPACRLVLV